MRVFIGLCEVAGYHSRLARGFAEIGVKVTYLTAQPHAFGYAGPSTPEWLQRWTHFAMGNRGGSPAWIRETAKLGLVLWLGLTHRGFIFPYASTFDLFGKPYAELPLLKWLGCKTIFVFHGSDSRPCFLERYGLYERDGKLVSGRTLIQRCDARLAQLRAIEKHATWIIANPLSAQWHIRECINWFLIGIPSPDPVAEPVYPERVKILHSPSEPLGKGTDLIRDAIESLKQKGHDFDYLELTDVPHETVLKELADCTLVIDQLYSDQPMAGLATEAAAFGKASIVGSYGWKELHEEAGMDEESGTWPPVIECHPDQIESELENCLNNQENVRKAGRKALDFISRQWTPIWVAKRFVQLIREKPERAWFFDPKGGTYSLGCTARPEQIKLMVSGVLAVDGKDALQLDHCLQVKEFLLDMIASPGDEKFLQESKRRISALEKALAAKKEKLENFHGMIERRDARIEKLLNRLR